MVLQKNARFSFSLQWDSEKSTGCICNCFFAIIVGKSGITAHLCYEQTVALHTGHGFFWKPAGVRVGARFTNAAAAGSKTKGVRVRMAKLFGKRIQIFYVLFFCFAVASAVDGFLHMPYGLKKNPAFIAVHLCLTFFECAAGRRACPVFSVRFASVGSTHGAYVFSWSQDSGIE